MRKPSQVLALADSQATITVYSTQRFHNGHGSGFNYSLLDGHVEANKNEHGAGVYIPDITPKVTIFPGTYRTAAQTKHIGFLPPWGDED